MGVHKPLVEKKTIGIIGCGLIADTHVEAIKNAIPDADICVCDSLQGKAELLRRKYNLKCAYTAIDQMLSEEKPYTVHILSPPQLHVDHALKCLEAGCHVLVEKPLAFDLGDVDNLYDVARRCNKTLCVDHSLFYQPSVLKMLEKLKADVEDQVLYVNCFYGIDTDGPEASLAPKGHWKQGLPGGPLIDTIIHPVTLAVEMTGKPVDMKVNFSGSIDNLKEVHISWEGEKAIASIIVSAQAQPFRRVTEITTKKKTFVVDHSTETLISLDSGFGPKALRKLLRNFGYGSQLILGTIGTVVQVMRGKLKGNPGARSLVEAFYRHLSDGSPLLVSDENVRNSVYALQKIIETLTKNSVGEFIEVKPEREGANHDQRHPIIKTLVTGASGFLGRQICDILSEKSRQVIAQVRRGVNADKIQSNHIEKIYEDFNYEPIDYDHIVDGAKEIIHCAHAAGAKTWEQFKKTNVDATVGLYEAAAKAGCEKFIFISSVAVYGVHQKGRITINEKTPTIMGKSKWDFYIRSKSLGEKVLLDRAKEGGPKLMIVRPGILYSLDGAKLARRSIPLGESRMVLVFGNGNNHQPFTRVDMLAETICRVLNFDKFPEGIYNLAGAPEETSAEFAYNRMKNLGIHCRFLTLPGFPLRCLGFMLEVMHTLTFRETMPKLTRYIIDSSTRDIYYDCSKAQKELGWNSKKAIEV